MRERSFSLAARTKVGLLLARRASETEWKPAKGTLSLERPIELVSLDDSWSEIEMDDSLSLVFSGPVEATVEAAPNREIEITLRRGRLGVRRLAEGASIRFAADDARARLRGVDTYSNVALYNDHRGAGAATITGQITIDEALLRQGEQATWTDGVLSPAQARSAFPPPPSGADPNDPNWIEPPDEAATKAWTAHYGGAANRLAIADSFRAELDRLLKSSRDARRVAVLSRWRMAIDSDDERAARLVFLLGDRRLLVRRSAVRYLIETSPKNESLLRLAPLLRRRYGDETTRQLLFALAAARRGERIAGPEAGQLANLLGHDDLAVREVGASLLLWRTGEMFAEAKSRPPEFDAAGPLAQRAAGQQQWRRSLRTILGRTP